MAVNIQMRRDIAVTWAAINPILAQGEIGVELDTSKAKLGDGLTHWNSLGYFIGGIDAADLNTSFTQGVPAATWVILHNLGKFPSVSVVDSAGSLVEGDVVHDNVNQVTLHFGAAFSGVAYLN